MHKLTTGTETYHFRCAATAARRGGCAQRKHKHKHKFLCLFLAFCFAFSSFFFCQSKSSAADASAPVVYTFDIGISPKEYQTLISDENEPVFSVIFSVDEGALLPGEIRLRGSGSKTLGLVLATKRIPVQFKFKKPIL